MSFINLSDDVFVEEYKNCRYSEYLYSSQMRVFCKDWECLKWIVWEHIYLFNYLCKLQYNENIVIVPLFKETLRKNCKHHGWGELCTQRLTATIMLFRTVLVICPLPGKFGKNLCIMLNHVTLTQWVLYHKSHTHHIEHSVIIISFSYSPGGFSSI